MCNAYVYMCTIIYMYARMYMYLVWSVLLHMWKVTICLCVLSAVVLIRLRSKESVDVYSRA